MTRCFYQPIDAVARQTESKACVCGTPLSFKIDQPLSNCCSHNPSPLESSNNNKMCVWICVMFMWLWLLLWMWLWMCVCAVTVPVVVVVVVVMVSAVIALRAFCSCCVSNVVCTCECFALEHNDCVAFIHRPLWKSRPVQFSRKFIYLNEKKREITTYFHNLYIYIATYTKSAPQNLQRWHTNKNDTRESVR